MGSFRARKEFPPLALNSLIYKGFAPAPRKESRMKTLLTFFLITLCLGLAPASARAEGAVVYKKQKRSLIDWENLDAQSWLDFDAWKLRTESIAKSPDWEQRLRERSLVESVGTVLSCVGECRVYRGSGHHKALYRTKVLEGDEIETEANSYIWIALIDGTMVRLSPQSSITFREVNLGLTQNFLHARFNHGNILWLARTPFQYAQSELRETDSLFLPLDFYEANPETKEVDIFGAENNDDILYELLVGTSVVPKQISRLNKLIESNNQALRLKPTTSLIVMGNGSIFGDNLALEAIVIPGKESLFKLRELSQLGVEGEDPTYVYNRADFYYRGYENTQSSPISLGEWNSVDARGRIMSRAMETSLMHMGEFLTSKIYTLNVARELWLEREFSFAHNQRDPLALATNQGYRLWEIQKNKEGITDLEEREQWILDYSRRIETSNLKTASLFRERIEARGDTWEYVEYGPHMINRALVNYIKKGESPRLKSARGPVLNSTTRLLWKKINALR